MNRSASVGVAYVALRQGMPLIEAVRSAMSQRGTVLTNRSFRLQLVRAVCAADGPLGLATSFPTSSPSASRRSFNALNLHPASLPAAPPDAAAGTACPRSSAPWSQWGPPGQPAVPMSKATPGSHERL